MIRLFVGLELPDALRERLAGFRGGIPNARWIEPADLHITLRFIGDVEEHVGETIHDALSEVSAPAFEAGIAGFDAFGSRRRAHSLHAKVERTPALLHLAEKVESAVVRTGLPAEQRKYTPHITVARLKDAPAARLEGFLTGNGMFSAGPVRFGWFTLFRSHLGRSGATYTVEARYPLKSDAPE